MANEHIDNFIRFKSGLCIARQSTAGQALEESQQNAASIDIAKKITAYDSNFISRDDRTTVMDVARRFATKQFIAQQPDTLECGHPKGCVKMCDDGDGYICEWCYDLKFLDAMHEVATTLAKQSRGLKNAIGLHVLAVKCRETMAILGDATPLSDPESH